MGSKVAALAALVLLASGATFAKGVDVSNYQGSSIDWPQVAAAGYTFAFAKASEGTTFTDATYAINRTGTRSAGLLLGAYHFARPAGTNDATIAASAIAQADHFVDVAQPRAGDLPPALDLETAGGLSAAALSKWAQAWLGEVAARTGIPALVYSSPNFWKTSVADTTAVAGGGHKLWVAHWTTGTAPTVPASAWGGLGWAFWQWSDCQSVPGISSKCVDADRANGADPGVFAVGPLPTGAPAPATQPTVLGTARAGAKLAAVPGTWSGGKPVSFVYQWQRCDAGAVNCVPLPGATLETYTPGNADIGHVLVVSVTATSKALAATAASQPTAPVAAASGATVPAVLTAPAVSGVAQIGQTLSVSAGSWSGSPTAYTYAWQRCDANGATCAPIAGATAPTYVLTPGDAGATVEALVSAVNSVGSQTAATALTGVVAPAPVPAATVGSLVAQPGQAGAVATADGAATVTWQPGAVPPGTTVSLTATRTSFALGLAPTLAPLPWPVDLELQQPLDDRVVGFSADGRVWSTVAPLTAQLLPRGVVAGVYGQHVVTRRPGSYRLFVANAWGDPRKVSRFAPRLRRVAPVRVSRLRSGALVVSTRMATPSQIVFLPGRRRLLAPGSFPVRLRVAAAS